MSKKDVDYELIARARRLKSRTARFLRLAELGAPPLILENERQLIFKGLMALPVDREALIASETLNEQMRKEEVEFLVKHGFYEESDESRDGVEGKTNG